MAAVADTPGGVAVLVARCALAGPGLLRRPVPSAPGRGRAWRRGTSCWAPSGPAAARRPGSAGADRALLRRAEADAPAGATTLSWVRWRGPPDPFPPTGVVTGLHLVVVREVVASGDECRCLWHRQRCGPLRGPWQCRRFAPRCGARRAARGGPLRWTGLQCTLRVGCRRSATTAKGAPASRRRGPLREPAGPISTQRRRRKHSVVMKKKDRLRRGPYSQGGGGSVTVCGPWVAGVEGWPGAPLGRSVTRRATRNPAGPPGRAASRSREREPGTPAGTRVRASLPDRPRGAPAHRAEPWRTPPGEAAAGGAEIAPDLRKDVMQITRRNPHSRWTRTPE
ncbi:hypothetical protein SALBM311S_10403 [Streptomyces alboniger]